MHAHMLVHKLGCEDEVFGQAWAAETSEARLILAGKVGHQERNIVYGLPWQVYV